MNQHRFIRLIKLMKFLEEKPRHIYTIKRYLKVSERTTYRYIECFKAIGYTIIKSKDLRYGLEKKLDIKE